VPELPEVETIRNELSPEIVGRRFTRVTVYDAMPVRQPDLEGFCRGLVGQKTSSLERRGKYLVFRLSNGGALIIHLKMTGVLLLNPEQADRYTRVVFQLDNGSQLIFADRRRLGSLWLVYDEKAIIGKLGPEPLSAEFSADALSRRLQKRRAPIKPVLLDQAVVAGIGNMYADEALFAAGIHPQRRANSLSLEETRDLHQAIHDVLSSAIGSKGASVDTYTRPDGGLGQAHFSFRVAHLGGRPCADCGTPIQRVTIRNRGSYFCPHCQKSPTNVPM